MRRKVYYELQRNPVGQQTVDIGYQLLEQETINGVFVKLIFVLFKWVIMPICRAYARYILADKPADIFMRFFCAFYFCVTHKYWPHFKNPRSFSEKVWNRMFYDRDPKWTMLSDKWRVRDYAAKKVGDDCLLSLIHI